MNSIKNAIVTATLLAVGYGAYVVLSNPVPEEVEEEVSADAWAVPAVEMAEQGEAATDAPSTEMLEPPAIDGPALDTEEPSDSSLATTPPTDVEDPSADASTDAPASNYYAQGAESSNESAEESNAYPSTSAPEWPLSGLTGPRGAENDPNTEADTETAESETAESTSTADDGESTDIASTEADTASSPDGGLEPPASDTDLTSPTADASAEGETAATSVAAPATSAHSGSSAFDTAWNEVQGQLQQGDLAESLLALSAWYGDPSLSPTQADKALNLLDQLAGSVIYSNESHLEAPYQVQRGDTFETVATEYQVSPDFLARVNAREVTDTLSEGEELKVVRGPFRAELVRETGVLTVYLGRNYAGRFMTRIGPDLPPQVSRLEVASIEAGREFFDHKSGFRVKANDPENPYGIQWISLRGDQITAGHTVGIHVDQPGHQDVGCIAVKEADALDLAAILDLGSRVTIK